ncbi:DUF11 domain-containing protein [Candidatus Parcubacteria bacterium]|nr:DUF11 domain-containing protein [Candidatus Parcubacteria bacterium]
MSHRRKQSARDVRQQLRSIYTPEGGKLPDMTRLSHKKTSKLTAFLLRTIGVLFVLSLLAWGGFFLFTRGLFDRGETLSVSIEAPRDIRSGEETSLEVRYENAGDVPIAELGVKVNLPESFHLTSALPESDRENEWDLGTLTPRSDGTIILKGIFLSPVPSVQRVQALFDYKPANFSSTFQEIESQSIEIKTSTVELAMTGPEKALAGDPVEYTIKVKHTGKDSVFNLRVLPTLPADFVVEKASPSMGAEEPFWEIAALEPGKVSEIKLTGAFTSTAAGELSVGAKIGFMDEENFYAQAESAVVTDVLGGAVSFHLILDGSDKDQTVEPGKILRGSVDFKNPGTEPVEGIVFTLRLEAAGPLPVDWEKAELSEGTRSTNTVRWDGKSVTALSKLEPGKEGVVDFTLPLASPDANAADVLTVSLSMDVARVGSLTGTRTIDATPITLRIASNARVQAEARYFAEDGTPLGQGELPPKVGATTSYRVLWDLTNSLHDLGAVEVSTTLPQDVSWKDASAKDIGALSYNPTTRQVRWQISKLPKEITQAQAWFDVAITPKASDVGTFVKLANQTTLEATDLATGTQTNSSVGVLTTELPTDEFASGKGAVR